ncbi:MAG: alpha/beta fold hydrolase [Candidatus Kariarchaeaceae archaeon]|jgi:pimeloyl-ACP methyl ester carboxylesterase
MPQIKIASGHTIGYRIIGDTSKPTIMFLNGSVFNYKQFYPVYLPRIQKALGDRYSLLLYDYTGVGESSGYKGEFDFLRLTDEAIELLDALNLDQVHLFGLSKGGLMAQFITAKYPDRILSFAGYGNPNLANDDKREMLEKDYKSRLQSVQSLKGIYHERVDDRNFEIVYDTVYAPTIFNKQVYQLGFGERLRNWWVRRKLHDMMMGTEIQFMDILFAYYLNKIADDERERYIEALRRIKKPALFMHGKRDEVIPYSSSELLHEWVEGSELELFDGFRHSRPTILPWEGKKIVERYLKFVQQY